MRFTTGRTNSVANAASAQHVKLARIEVEAIVATMDAALGEVEAVMQNPYVADDPIFDDLRERIESTRDLLQEALNE